MIVMTNTTQRVAILDKSGHEMVVPLGQLHREVGATEAELTPFWIDADQIGHELRPGRRLLFHPSKMTEEDKALFQGMLGFTEVIDIVSTAMAVTDVVVKTNIGKKAYPTNCFLVEVMIPKGDSVVRSLDDTHRSRYMLNKGLGLIASWIILFATVFCASYLAIYVALKLTL